MYIRYCTIIVVIISFSCGRREVSQQPCNGNGKRFTQIPSSHSNITFVNALTYTEEFNTYTYRNFYNGAGVGIGDVNNDGLADLFFCGNMVSNKLYLNQGNFRFVDVTDAAGLSSEGVWSTGVSLADVNGDGWLDIYVCKAGKPKGTRRHNELFINAGLNDKGIPTFVEKSNDYGVDDLGLSIHAAFFDYDKDGDLDMYLLNNSIRSVGGFDLQKDQRLINDPDGGNKLYRNDGGRFVNVTKAAGIYSSIIGYGLGVTIGDVNKDGWQDIFVSNDFFERDYLYINKGDGTFQESLEKSMSEISLGSMGADMADINNDGFPEIFVTEMLPQTEERLKTKTIFEDWDKYQANYKAGYHRQFPRNVLQWNRGRFPGQSNGDVMFSEISRYAGVSATDWSWGALIADFDNDGLSDIFVANGIGKDLTDLDYINFNADPVTTRKLYQEKGMFLKELIDKIPSNPIPNYAFKNTGTFSFVNATDEWGLDCPSFSSGSSYGDLDNDGDLDLVVNNSNMAPFLLRNNTDSLSANHFVELKLSSAGRNTNGFGTQVTIKGGGMLFYREVAPMRGYQSTVDSKLHFGVGSATAIDSIIIQWPNSHKQVLTNVEVDKLIDVHQPTVELKKVDNKITSVQPVLFTDVSEQYNIGHVHTMTTFSDFDRDPLLFQMLSAEGPKIAVGDINGNGTQDFFIGRGKEKESSLCLQTMDGKFRQVHLSVLETDHFDVDSGVELFDADNDRDLDLYVSSGGNDLPTNSEDLIDRLYLNDGKGGFTLAGKALPRNLLENTSCVKAADIDLDGDQDLFVGTRTKPFQYGLPMNGYVLINDGKGRFENMTDKIAKSLLQLGMITDATWFDYDGDRDPDLVIVGDWMPITLLRNDNGILVNINESTGLSQTSGFWNCIEAADVDKDGKVDLVAGNHGMNSRLRASFEKPVRMYVSDFDGNGKVEQILTTYNGEKEYPIHMRTDLVEQIPSLKKKYLLHKNYGGQSVNDIFGEAVLSKSHKLTAYTTQSLCLLNKGGKFIQYPLPMEAQLSPVYAIGIDDYDGDRIPDLLLGGNFRWSKPEVGIYNAEAGLMLKGDGDGKFHAITRQRSGVCIEGEIRDIKILKNAKDNLVIISRNNDKPVILRRNIH